MQLDIKGEAVGWGCLRPGCCGECLDLCGRCSKLLNQEIHTLCSYSNFITACLNRYDGHDSGLGPPSPDALRARGKLYAFPHFACPLTSRFQTQ
jgi:hypothetical protein